MKLNASRKKDVTAPMIDDGKIKNENSAIKMLPGFVAKVPVRCGKQNCHCARGHRHTAHYHVTYYRGVRSRKYVRRDRVAEVLAACEANRALQGQLRAGRTEYKELLAQTQKLIKLLCQ
jgi:hypothetical protein